MTNESARHIVRAWMIFNGYQRVFLCPLAQILIPQIPPTQKGKEVVKGTLHSPVAAAEKEILSGAGQEISFGWNAMGRKCDANLAAAVVKQRINSEV